MVNKPRRFFVYTSSIFGTKNPITFCFIKRRSNGLAMDGLADDWEMLSAALRDIDRASRSHSTSGQGDTGSSIMITKVRSDPRLGEGTSTLECQRGGIEEVVDIQVGEFHAEGLAHSGGLVVGNGRVDYSEAIALAAWCVARCAVMVTGASGRFGRAGGSRVGARARGRRGRR